MKLVNKYLVFSYYIFGLTSCSGQEVYKSDQEYSYNPDSLAIVLFEPMEMNYYSFVKHGNKLKVSSMLDSSITFEWDSTVLKKLKTRTFDLFVNGKYPIYEHHDSSFNINDNAILEIRFQDEGNIVERKIRFYAESPYPYSRELMMYILYLRDLSRNGEKRE